MSPLEERDYVRGLARQAREIALDEPRMKAIVKRWKDVNELRKPDRAPVWCKPVGCWTELLPEESLRCSNPELRALERSFRQTLIKREIDDDTPVYPWFECHAVVESDPPNLWGLEPARHKPDSSDGAWAYEPTVKSLEDFEKLALPSFRVDKGKTLKRKAALEEILGDALPVKTVLHPGFGHATPGLFVCDYLGMTEMMTLMATEPELVLKMAGLFRDAELRKLDALEASGLLTENNYAPMELSDSFGPSSPDGGISLKNLWSSGNSQEYDQVSPEMWREFCLEFQKPLFERFGRVIYGCCENLTKKIDGVLSIPNLRVFVCSAWTNLDVVLERVGTRYCLMWRQKASDVVCPESLDKLGEAMDLAMRKLEGRSYQIVLRELQTLYGRPKRLHEWTALAKRLAEAHA